MKFFLLFVWLFFMVHMAAALANDSIIVINQPNGGQTVCVYQGSYVVCYQFEHPFVYPLGTSIENDVVPKIVVCNQGLTIKKPLWVPLVAQKA